MDLQQLRIANIHRNSERDPHKVITPLFRATELAGEVGEADLSAAVRTSKELNLSTRI